MSRQAIDRYGSMSTDTGFACLPAHTQDMVIVLNGLLAILLKVVVVNVTAIHECVLIIWSNAQCLIQILQCRSIILHPHIGIGAIVVRLGIVWIECERLGIHGERFLAVSSIKCRIAAL